MIHKHPVMPFGQYKGACAHRVAEHDRQYAEWCLAQEGLTEQYPEVCNFWLSLGVKPMEYCHATTKDGNPCTRQATDGTLCRMHYKLAEKAMMTAIDAMELDLILP